MIVQFLAGVILMIMLALAWCLDQAGQRDAAAPAAATPALTAPAFAIASHLVFNAGLPSLPRTPREPAAPLPEVPL